MSKVITFSKTFPKYHPKAGELTNFQYKIIRSLGYDEIHNVDGSFTSLENFAPKHHTIRAGHRWKVGDKFSPRIWSGKPYHSKQITIAPDIEIKKVWNFEIQMFHEGYWIDFGGYHIQPYGYTTSSAFSVLAKNDGFDNTQDLVDWLKYPTTFKGQIICWNDKIEY